MDHKDLDVWKQSIELVAAVYTLTSDFPREEQYGLTAQLRRTAVSIPSNIAEGAARNSDKEFIQFLHISLGSLAELETQFILAERLWKATVSPLLKEVQVIRKMVIGLVKYLKSKRVSR